MCSNERHRQNSEGIKESEVTRLCLYVTGNSDEVGMIRSKKKVCMRLSEATDRLSTTVFWLHTTYRHYLTCNITQNKRKGKRRNKTFTKSQSHRSLNHYCAPLSILISFSHQIKSYVHVITTITSISPRQRPWTVRKTRQTRVSKKQQRANLAERLEPTQETTGNFLGQQWRHSASGSPRERSRGQHWPV